MDHAYAEALLLAAEEVERDEAEIKRQLLDAVQRGEFKRVEVIVTRWLSRPVREVLASAVIENDDTRPALANSREESSDSATFALDGAKYTLSRV